MVKLRTPEKQIKPTPENLSITFQCKVKKTNIQKLSTKKGLSNFLHLQTLIIFCNKYKTTCFTVFLR